VSGKSKYRHVFFDLDHTLWDFKSNSREALRDIYSTFDLPGLGVPNSMEFIATYEKVNDALWVEYRRHQIDKTTLRNTRFNRVLSFWEISDEKLAEDINEHYLGQSPYKTRLMPGAREILDHLQGNYDLHLITNGFKEIQNIKIDQCDIRKYFREVIISEDVGVQKPHPLIFETSEQRTGARSEECIYIGDHPESDVQGSKDAGWDQVWYNPESIDHHVVPTYEISHFDELKEIF